MTRQTDLHFEDFTPGLRIEGRSVTLTEADIIDFALRYDPQPFHVDRETAARSNFGGLIASGFQTLAMSWRLLYQTGFLHHSNLGGPGMDEVRWPRALSAGDTLSATAVVSEVRASKSKPDRGVVKFAVSGVNQRGETVLTATMMIMAKRRQA